MRYFILFNLSISLFSCKKDYACYGSETVYYKWSRINNNGFEVITETQQDFVTRQSCMNCSDKDVDQMGKIMTEYLLDMETQYEEPFLEEYDKMYSKTREDIQLYCDERE